MYGETEESVRERKGKRATDSRCLKPHVRERRNAIKVQYDFYLCGLYESV